MEKDGEHFVLNECEQELSGLAPRIRITEAMSTIADLYKSAESCDARAVEAQTDPVFSRRQTNTNFLTVKAAGMRAVAEGLEALLLDS